MNTFSVQDMVVFSIQLTFALGAAVQVQPIQVDEEQLSDIASLSSTLSVVVLYILIVLVGSRLCTVSTSQLVSSRYKPLLLVPTDG